MSESIQILGAELVLTPPVQDFEAPIIPQRRNTTTATCSTFQLLGRKPSIPFFQLMNGSQNTDAIATNEFKALSNSIKLSLLNARACE